MIDSVHCPKCHFPVLGEGKRTQYFRLDGELSIEYKTEYKCKACGERFWV